MLKTAILTLSAASMIAAPTAASARDHDWNRHHKVRTVETVRYVPNRTRYVSTRYASPYYGSRYYGSNAYGGYYGSPYYGNSYYGSPYYGNGYNSRYYGERYRCGNGTTGALIGGALGAVVGSQVATSHNRYGYRTGNGTAGALIGGALGAVVGSQVAQGRC
ncbi:glycine zipper 2TM domain-containing protein [Sphingomonas daechungensis]|uniref:glycine zipper 2TM domain-containing protein n=1 Tax=Sphingomonas daechungensis TaxID=1176646 RepID=UPI0037833761